MIGYVRLRCARGHARSRASAMGVVIIIKLVTSIMIVLSLAYFNWWLTSVYPSTVHRDSSDPMGPWLWNFQMNVTNVTILLNGTYSPVSYDDLLFAKLSTDVVLVTFAHPTEFRYAIVACACCTLQLSAM